MKVTRLFNILIMQANNKPNAESGSCKLEIGSEVPDGGISVSGYSTLQLFGKINGQAISVCFKNANGEESCKRYEVKNGVLNVIDIGITSEYPFVYFKSETKLTEIVGGVYIPTFYYAEGEIEWKLIK